MIYHHHHNTKRKRSRAADSCTRLVYAVLLCSPTIVAAGTALPDTPATAIHGRSGGDDDDDDDTMQRGAESTPLAAQTLELPTTPTTTELLSSPFLDSFQEEVHEIVANYRAEVRKTFRQLKEQLQQESELTREWQREYEKQIQEEEAEEADRGKRQYQQQHRGQEATKKTPLNIFSDLGDENTDDFLVGDTDEEQEEVVVRLFEKSDDETQKEELPERRKRKKKKKRKASAQSQRTSGTISKHQTVKRVVPSLAGGMNNHANDQDNDNNDNSSPQSSVRLAPPKTMLERRYRALTESSLGQSAVKVLTFALLYVLCTMALQLIVKAVKSSRPT